MGFIQNAHMVVASQATDEARKSRKILEREAKLRGTALEEADRIEQARHRELVSLLEEQNQLLRHLVTAIDWQNAMTQAQTNPPAPL